MRLHCHWSLGITTEAGFGFAAAGGTVVGRGTAAGGFAAVAIAVGFLATIPGICFSFAFFRVLYALDSVFEDLALPKS